MKDIYKELNTILIKRYNNKYIKVSSSYVNLPLIIFDTNNYRNLQYNIDDFIKLLNSYSIKYDRIDVGVFQIYDNQIKAIIGLLRMI